MPNFSNFIQDDDEIVEEDEEEETQTKFALSGLDFKEYIKAIQVELMGEMEQLCNLYVAQKVKRHHQVHLT